MEQAKLESAEHRDGQQEALPGGFRRQITTHPWHPGLALITVTVTFPAGGRFDLYRLQKLGATQQQQVQTAPVSGPE